MKPELSLDYFLYLVRVKRPAYGKGVKRMHKIITKVTGIMPDAHGNIIASIPNGTQPSTTLFSCHIDTACRDEGDIKFQMVRDEVLQADILLTDGKSIMGADDAAGIFIMLNMWVQGIAGTYIFHEGEEVGGIGSSAMASGFADFLQKHKRAIAFDRAGTTDIITSQATGICCSDHFAMYLGDSINEASGGTINMLPAAGIFTDTANYNHLIPECTNISVGYDFEHTHKEEQNIDFLLNLTNSVMAVEWDALPTVREVHETVSDQELYDITQLVREYPKQAAELLSDSGYDAYELLHYFKET